MAERNIPDYAPNNLVERPLAYYRQKLAETTPEEITERVGIIYDGKNFILPVMGSDYRISWPEGTCEGISDKELILYLHYLTEGKKSEESTEFYSYADLPWGDVYDKNFKGRCIFFLLRVFGKTPEKFREVCEAFHGVPMHSSGTAYKILFTEGYAVQLILWEGDEEFPPSAQILFSGNFPEGFAAEDRVVVCEVMIGKMRAYLREHPRGRTALIQEVL